MRDRLSGLQSFAAVRDWRQLCWRIGLVGFWLLRGVLGVALVVYALSFLGPPPVESSELGYDSPSGTAHDAVENLRSGTYRLTLEGSRTNESGETSRLVEETRIVDNPAHQYERRVGTGGVSRAGDASTGIRRQYGTYAAGFQQESGGPDRGASEWKRDDSARYNPARNVFSAVDRLADARATVRTDGIETYEVRIEDRNRVAAVVDLPDHTQRRSGDWNASLTLTVARDTDRLARADYLYSVPETGVTVQATYRFEYGPLVDVDRPLATYPPGEETVGRFDLGIRAADGLVRGVVS